MTIVVLGISFIRTKIILIQLIDNLRDEGDRIINNNLEGSCSVLFCFCFSSVFPFWGGRIVHYATAVDIDLVVCVRRGPLAFRLFAPRGRSSRAHHPTYGMVEKEAMAQRSTSQQSRLPCAGCSVVLVVEIPIRTRYQCLRVRRYVAHIMPREPTFVFQVYFVVG